MIAGSRRTSVQTVHGFWLSMFPHTRQTSIFSSAVCIAAASGAMICSRFLIRNSAARRAERGPSPGRRASNWIRRSISGPATALGMPCAGRFSEQLQSRRERQATGDGAHLLLHKGLDLAAGVGVGGDDQILDDLLFIRLDQTHVDLDALHVALAVEPHCDEAAAGGALDLGG